MLSAQLFGATTRIWGFANFGNVRFSANTWLAVRVAEGRTGKPGDDLYESNGEYGWMRFEAGDECKMRVEWFFPKTWCAAQDMCAPSSSIAKAAFFWRT